MAAMPSAPVAFKPNRAMAPQERPMAAMPSAPVAFTPEGRLSGEVHRAHGALLRWRRVPAVYRSANGARC